MPDNRLQHLDLYIVGLWNIINVECWMVYIYIIYFHITVFWLGFVKAQGICSIDLVQETTCWSLALAWILGRWSQIFGIPMCPRYKLRVVGLEKEVEWHWMSTGRSGESSQEMKRQLLHFSKDYLELNVSVKLHTIVCALVCTFLPDVVAPGCCSSLSISCVACETSLLWVQCSIPGTARGVLQLWSFSAGEFFKKNMWIFRPKFFTSRVFKAMIFFTQEEYGMTRICSSRDDSPISEQSLHIGLRTAFGHSSLLFVFVFFFALCCSGTAGG